MGLWSFFARGVGSRGVKRRVVVSSAGILVEYLREPGARIESSTLHPWDGITAIRVFGCCLDDTDAGRPEWTIEIRAGAPFLITSAFCRLEEVLEHLACLPDFDRDEAHRVARTSAREPVPYCWTRPPSVERPPAIQRTNT